MARCSSSRQRNIDGSGHPCLSGVDQAEAGVGRSLTRHSSRAPGVTPLDIEGFTSTSSGGDQLTWEP